MAIALIPARGGSKGIKDKNIIDVAGKPLISYCLEACLQSKSISSVWVSTDSERIARVVRNGFGSEVEIKYRPDELASDDSITEDTIAYHLEKSLPPGTKGKALLVQATSVFTTPEDLDQLVIKLNDFDSAAFYIEDYGHFFDIDNLNSTRLPRQARSPRRREAGNAWAFDIPKFMVTRTRLNGTVGLVKIDPLRAIEIDTYEDLLVVEHLLKSEGLSRQCQTIG